MKLLFVVLHFNSVSNANVSNALELINHYIDKGDKVDIVATDGLFAGNQCKISQYRKARVFTFSDIYNRYLFRKGLQKNEFTKLSKIEKFCLRSLCYFRTLFKFKTEYYSVDALNFGKLFKKFDRDYDVVFSFSHPFAAHSIGYYLLKKHYAKSWFPVLFDSFIFNDLDSKKGIPKRKRVSETILSKANKVFSLFGINEINTLNDYIPKYVNNVVEIPTLNLYDRHLLSTKTNKVEIYYLGSFYKDIRNPERMLDILASLPSEYHIHFLSAGCSKIINEKIGKFHGNFYMEPLVKSSQVNSVYENATVLINLSNKIGNYFPSKVFELISTGKPILNFYFNDNDPSQVYLKQYKNVCNINLFDSLQYNVKKIKCFVKKNNNVILSFNQSSRRLEEYKKENVLKFIDENLSNGLDFIK